MVTSTESTFEKIFDNVEKMTEQNVNRNEGDYIQDGLLYCGKCHTAKQVRVTLFGQERTPYCLCKCAAAERDRKEAEFKKMQRNLRIEELRKMGFPEREMQKWTFAADDCANDKISKIARNYVANFPEMKKRGKGLLFFGTVGTGKTFYSACIVNALIDEGYPCMITNFARLVNTLSGMFEGKQDYIDKLNRFDLLVIDDLATERDTEYVNEIVQNIIDSRYRAGLPTIITTNLTDQEIKNPTKVQKQRMFSRLLEMCIPVEVVGSDRRRKKLKNDFNELKDILGIDN